ncbi:hypothetical protein GCM10009764_11040 [Nocardia ninae]|uniref:Uncharacterized protein n=1 Tax=Nocardia ninae NBRC 108245 TaxID=1210091 RepID=A0A511MRL6_9NOCA|nr:hypothetical protein NN4_77720 [Nocardia ninae NBRC 108245]
MLVGCQRPNRAEQSRLSDTRLSTQDQHRAVSGDRSIQELSQHGRIPVSTNQSRLRKLTDHRQILTENPRFHKVTTQVGAVIGVTTASLNTTLTQSSVQSFD